MTNFGLRMNEPLRVIFLQPLLSSKYQQHLIRLYSYDWFSFFASLLKLRKMLVRLLELRILIMKELRLYISPSTQGVVSSTSVLQEFLFSCLP